MAQGDEHDTTSEAPPLPGMVRLKFGGPRAPVATIVAEIERVIRSFDDSSGIDEALVICAANAILNVADYDHDKLVDCFTEQLRAEVRSREQDV
jgi:hypothetical protein